MFIQLGFHQIQAFLEKMQRELDEKKAKLAEVEQSLQKTTVVGHFA